MYVIPAALQNGTAAPDPTADAIDFLSFLLSLIFAFFTEEIQSQ
ncbi:unnamed protein product, partial [Vitis vinifera]